MFDSLLSFQRHAAGQEIHLLNTNQRNCDETTLMRVYGFPKYRDPNVDP